MSESRSERPLVVVMGVSGCGKSSLMEVLARRTGLPSQDGDSFHSQANIAKMHAGTPLTDADREPWLRAVGAWLAEHSDTGAIVTCSALARRYRDQIRSQAPDAFFVHLAGPQEEALRRVTGRKGHFMPASLVASQYQTLEQLGADERGITLDFREDDEKLADETLAALGWQQG